jgi:hypothetical protein
MMNSDWNDWRKVLRREFEAEDGSFLATAQAEYRWDQNAFRELIEAMRDGCVRCAEDDQLDRWMAHVFFYVPAFIRAWTQQEGFDRPDDAYWQRAINLLEALSHWFFWGEPPTKDGDIDVLMLN